MFPHQIHDILRSDVRFVIQRLEHHRARRRRWTSRAAEGDNFDRNKSLATRLPSTMHALTIFIQRPYRQATLLAKGRSQQSTRFKLADQGLDLGQTTSPAYHSHFAHCSSATLNRDHEQGALLRRIPSSCLTRLRGRRRGHAVPDGLALAVVLPSAFPVSRRTVYISSLQSGHFHGPFHVPNPDTVSFGGLKVFFVSEFLHFAFVQRAPTIIGASYVFSPALCRSSVMMPR